MTEKLELQPADAEEYKVCKRVLTEGAVICFVVGAAARKIKEKQWFLADGYETWDDFIAEEYGWTRRYVDQLIVDANTINSLPEGMRKFITSHKAAQALSQVPEIFRAAVVEAASKGGKKTPTATDIKKNAPPTPKRKAPPAPTKKPAPPKAPASKPGPKPKPPTDETGQEIPTEVLELWNRAPEAQELMTLTSSLRSKLLRFQEAKDVLFAEVDFVDALAKLQNVYMTVARAKPYAVCPSCVGKLAKDCTTCKGRGFVSQFFWDHVVAEEVKNMRKGGK